MAKITVEELIEKNQAKRAKKLKKMGIDSGNTMAQLAKTSTKSIEVEEPKSTKDYANISGKDYGNGGLHIHYQYEYHHPARRTAVFVGLVLSYP